jgi:hypothetical protein
MLVKSFYYKCRFATLREPEMRGVLKPGLSQTEVIYSISRNFTQKQSLTWIGVSSFPEIPFGVEGNAVAILNPFSFLNVAPSFFRFEHPRQVASNNPQTVKATA